MGVFSYKAIDLDATIMAGTIVADTPRQARDLLRSRGLTITDLAARDSIAIGNPWQQLGVHLRGKRLQKHVLEFVRELATLLGVGIPMLEALDTVAKQHRGAFQLVILTLRDRVAAGASLAQAMAEQPAIFDMLCINMTEVGESAGNLDFVLEQLASYRERVQQLKGRIGTALLYPLIVLSAGIGVAIFLMTVVVPELLQSIIQAGKPLPLSTVIVKTMSDGLVKHWPILITSLFALIAGVWLLLRTRRGRRLWHQTQLRLPMVGEIIRKQAIVRIAVVISTLIKSGIVFARAIHNAQSMTSNVVISDALARCEKAIEAGRDIGQALKDTQAFPPTVVQIFAVGQQSGRLEEMLDRLATDYDRQVTTAAQRIASVIEPILIILLALIVGVIAYATIMPILEAGNVM